ncbi:hypothetical protein DMX09_14905 [Pseudomonas protegens]|uniref:hypothetical protein n=1 Tax=Pseudomonas protegens TaxID=380021 RepID=UPI000D81F993|nr:hypothetical protein [Pseudomonas protegens]PYC04711.1 hypothetical protein DMX09_14905 [Pseudomonas protegens]
MYAALKKASECSFTTRKLRFLGSVRLFMAELRSIVVGDDSIDEAECGVANGQPIDSGNIVIWCCGTGKTIVSSLMVNALTKALDEAEQARKALEIITSYYRFIGSTPSLQREVKYWFDVLAFARATVAKFFILFAYSRCSFQELPLFADGPELNGYKHRLR